MRRDLQKLFIHASIAAIRSTHRSYSCCNFILHIEVIATETQFADMTYGHALCDIYIEQFRKRGLIVGGFNLTLSPLHKNHFTLVGH